MNLTPAIFNYLKRSNRWTGDPNLATVSMFILALSIPPLLLLLLFPSSRATLPPPCASCLSLCLTLTPFLKKKKNGRKWKKEGNSCSYAQGKKKKRRTYLNCQPMIVRMSQQGGKNEGIEAWNKGINDKGEENEGELLVCELWKYLQGDERRESRFNTRGSRPAENISQAGLMEFLPSNKNEHTGSVLCVKKSSEREWWSIHSFFPSLFCDLGSGGFHFSTFEILSLYTP